MKIYELTITPTNIILPDGHVLDGLIPKYDHNEFNEKLSELNTNDLNDLESLYENLIYFNAETEIHIPGVVYTPEIGKKASAEGYNIGSIPAPDDSGVELINIGKNANHIGIALSEDDIKDEESYRGLYNFFIVT